MESPSWDRDTIQAVMVVPMLAPMMTPTAWFRVMSPALTKPTTMTVVAPELWMMAVIRAPTPTAMKRLLVSMPRKSFILLPADFCIPSAMMRMPYRNIPRPPMNRNRFVTCVSILPSPENSGIPPSVQKPVPPASWFPAVSSGRAALSRPWSFSGGPGTAPGPPGTSG